MLRIGRLHALTDGHIQSRFDHIELARLMISGGADVIQYREKHAPIPEMIRTARAVAALCRRAGVRLIVNDRVDVALAADADGVHLGACDFPVTMARRILGPDRIIGASVDTVEEADAAWSAGADYVGFGPIYATTTKSDTGPVVSVDRLREWLPRFRLPVVAIGGITPENVDAVIDAGAHGVAVLSAICAANDPEAATRAFAEKLGLLEV